MMRACEVGIGNHGKKLPIAGVGASHPRAKFIDFRHLVEMFQAGNRNGERLHKFCSVRHLPTTSRERKVSKASR